MKAFIHLALALLLPSCATADPAAPSSARGDDDPATDPPAAGSVDVGEVDGVSPGACASPSSCPAGLGCVEGACAPCELHAQCPSEVCDVYQPTALGPGRCVPEDEVLYVDGKGVHGSQCAGTGDGSKADPFCSIDQAIAAAGGDRTNIRVYPGTYFPFSVTGQKLTIYGARGEGGSTEVTEEDINGSSVLEGADVTLDGLALGRHSRYGVRCAGESAWPRLTVRISEVLSDTGTGLKASGCDLTLDRDRVSGLYGAMELHDTDFVMTNNVVSGASERTAIRLEGSRGQLLFNTVIGNGGPSLDGPGAIDCGSEAVTLSDSIVFGNSAAPSGSQLAGACVLRRVVIGSADTSSSPGAIRLDPELAGYELPVTPANLDCCIDRAETDPSIRTDIEGTPRPQGPRFDIGAYEAPL